MTHLELDTNKTHRALVIVLLLLQIVCSHFLEVYPVQSDAL
jgi:hypothetical protein